jgi:GTPase
VKPIISIVGRPNVGKSTLFNRILGYRKAITEDTPGVTRDRNYGEFEYLGKTFLLVDTGGFDAPGEDRLISRVVEQVHAAVEESSAIIFLLDCKDGILPQDEEINAALRRYDKPIFFAVNKVDSVKREADAAQFFSLGAEKLYPLTALHGTGVIELMEDLARSVESEPEDAVDQGVRIAFVGKPNTGKSSLVNCLLGTERMLVSEIPGTTRDSIDSSVSFRDRTLTIIDTAGMRKKAKVAVKVEELSVMSAIRSVERADVVNIVIDTAEGVGRQDAIISHLVVSRGKGICIVMNKWDMAGPGASQARVRDAVREKMPHADFAPVVFTSALTGDGVETMLSADLGVADELAKRVPTPKLNRAFEEFQQQTPLPQSGRRHIKIFYANQADTSPPTFLLFANYPELVPEHYKRYLANQLRDTFGFAGAPLRLVFKKR